MTLGEIIDAQIRATGPISLSTYMRLCLSHPEFGYYVTGNPLGKSGDFITAPEISQTFGEMIGIWAANLWTQLGSPKSFTIAELGPGRGTLMADALRATRNVPGFHQALHLVVVESNQKLRAEQKSRLADYKPVWVAEIAEIDGDGPLIVIANEFFDALPVKQYQKGNEGWHERLVGIEDGKRKWGLSPTPIPEASMPTAIAEADEHAIWEHAGISIEVMAELAALIAKRGGACLAIDYGYGQTQTGNTLQALEHHEHADPLAHPGKADLTAHVDFQALGEAAQGGGLSTTTLITQSQFLGALGIEARRNSLMANNPTKAEDIAAAVERLISPAQMGSLFKVFCAYVGDEPPYPFTASNL